jgi:hypothetical protein
MRIDRLFALALGAAVLCGCVETRFESPLGDNIETCDARWKGLWIVDGSLKDDVGAFWIDEACRFTVLDQPERGAPFKQIHVPVNYVHDKGKDYLVVTDVALKSLVELKPPYAIDPAPQKSFFFARYNLRGNHLEISGVDTEAVAKLVVDGKLQGTISKTASELHVFVRGDRAAMLEIVRSNAIFGVKPTLVLNRANETPAEYEKMVIQSQHDDKKP